MLHYTKLMTAVQVKSEDADTGEPVDLTNGSPDVDIKYMNGVFGGAAGIP